MSVRRLDIDFRRVRRPTTWSGALILTVGLVAVTGVAAMHQQHADEVEALESSARKLKRAPRAALPATALSAKELNHMQTVVKQLNLPWERFFSGMEKAASEDVVLLNVQPDAAHGKVRIAGEARDYTAALRCIEALNAGGIFRDAQLVEHEVNQQNREAPVRFTVSARWKPE